MQKKSLFGGYAAEQRQTAKDTQEEGQSEGKKV